VTKSWAEKLTLVSVEKAARRTNESTALSTMPACMQQCHACNKVTAVLQSCKGQQLLSTMCHPLRGVIRGNMTAEVDSGLRTPRHEAENAIPYPLSRIPLILKPQPLALAPPTRLRQALKQQHRQLVASGLIWSHMVLTWCSHAGY
jgi:hypothetical protein